MNRANSGRGGDRTGHEVIAAVGGPPPADAALHATRALLAEVADPAAFIEAASGRSDAAVLPVIR